MRHHLGMAKTVAVLDALEPDLDQAVAKRRGPIGKLFRLVTLPIRLVLGVIKALLAVVRGVVKLALIPLRLAVAAIRGVVNLASDITFAIWRGVAKIIGVVLGLVKLVFRVLDATIGGAIRLVLRIVKGTVKFVLGGLIPGKRRRRRRKAKAVVDAITPGP